MMRSPRLSSWVEAALWGDRQQPDAPSRGAVKDQAYRNAWDEIRAMPAGNKIEYHAGMVGSLAALRETDPALDGRAEAFSRATESGHGMVYQHRSDAGRWSYRFRKLHDG